MIHGRLHDPYSWVKLAGVENNEYQVQKRRKCYVKIGKCHVTKKETRKTRHTIRLYDTTDTFAGTKRNEPTCFRNEQPRLGTRRPA